MDQSVSPTAPVAGAPSAAQVTIPDQWPGAFGIYKYSSAAVKLNIWMLLALWIGSFIVGGLLGLSNNIPLHFIGSLISTCFSLAVGVATVRYLIAGSHGQKLTLQQAFANIVPVTLKYLGLSIVTGFVLLVSMLLLFIPFLFVMPRLSLASYYLIDKNMGVFESYWASWHATKGNAMKVWGIIGVGFLMTLLMFTLIGIPVAIYLLIMYSASTVLLYEVLTRQASPALANAGQVTAPPVDGVAAPVPPLQ